MNPKVHRLALALTPWGYSAVAGLIFGSCRISHQGPGYDLYKEGIRPGAPPFIITIWHHGVVLIPWMYRHRHYAAMVSASEDGEFIARILEHMGCATVRGSRNRRGLAALKGLIAMVKKEGRIVGIVADGSQGPALVAQPGAVILASHTGSPIIPMVWGADRYWTFRSWDRMVLPKPFSRIAVWYGAPLSVPAGLDAEGLDGFRIELERRMLEAYEKAWGTFGLCRHWGERL